MCLCLFESVKFKSWAISKRGCFIRIITTSDPYWTFVVHVWQLTYWIRLTSLFQGCQFCASSPSRFRTDFKVHEFFLVFFRCGKKYISDRRLDFVGCSTDEMTLTFYRLAMKIEDCRGSGRIFVLRRMGHTQVTSPKRKVAMLRKLPTQIRDRSISCAPLQSINTFLDGSQEMNKYNRLDASWSLEKEPYATKGDIFLMFARLQERKVPMWLASPYWAHRSALMCILSVCDCKEGNGEGVIFM